jgi:hypothetical protein
MSHRLNISAIFTLFLLSCNAWASEPSDTDFSIDGFGTLGVLHSDYRKADFVTSNPLHGSGVGYTRSWSADQDSKLGVQLSADFGRVSAVVQGITQLRYDNTFTPQLEWANLRFAITPELSVRAGRVVLPTFLSSDSENVGYSRPWVRTPGEIRVQLPMTSSDGVDLSYHFSIGEASHELQLLLGSNKSNLPQGEVFENKRIRALTDTIEYGHLILHLGYQRMHYQIAPNPVEYAFEAIDIGAAYDPGGWYVIAEQFNTYDEAMGNVRAHSLGGGYHVGSVTPYLVWAKIRQTSVGSLKLEPVLDQQTLAAGVRWDFVRNVALKLQYETIRIGSLAIPASFVNLRPEMRIGDHAHVFSATLDFVW